MAVQEHRRLLLKWEIDEFLVKVWTRHGSYPCEAEWCSDEGTEETESGERYCEEHFERLGEVVDHGPGCDGPLNCVCRP